MFIKIKNEIYNITYHKYDIMNFFCNINNFIEKFIAMKIILYIISIIYASLRFDNVEGTGL